MDNGQIIDELSDLVKLAIGAAKKSFPANLMALIDRRTAPLRLHQLGAGR